MKYTYQRQQMDGLSIFLLNYM